MVADDDPGFLPHHDIALQSDEVVMLAKHLLFFFVGMLLICFSYLRFVFNLQVINASKTSTSGSIHINQSTIVPIIDAAAAKFLVNSIRNRNQAKSSQPSKIISGQSHSNIPTNRGSSKATPSTSTPRSVSTSSATPSLPKLSLNNRSVSDSTYSSEMKESTNTTSASIPPPKIRRSASSGSGPSVFLFDRIEQSSSDSENEFPFQDESSDAQVTNEDTTPTSENVDSPDSFSHPIITLITENNSTKSLPSLLIQLPEPNSPCPPIITNVERTEPTSASFMSYSPSHKNHHFGTSVSANEEHSSFLKSQKIGISPTQSPSHNTAQNPINLISSFIEAKNSSSPRFLSPRGAHLFKERQDSVSRLKLSGELANGTPRWNFSQMGGIAEENDDISSPTPHGIPISSAPSSHLSTPSLSSFGSINRHISNSHSYSNPASSCTPPLLSPHSFLTLHAHERMWAPTNSPRLVGISNFPPPAINPTLN